MICDERLATAKPVLFFHYAHLLLSSMGLLLMFVTVSSAMVRNAFNFNLPQSLITAGREREREIESLELV